DVRDLERALGLHALRQDVRDRAPRAAPRVHVVVHLLDVARAGRAERLARRAVRIALRLAADVAHDARGAAIEPPKLAAEPEVIAERDVELLVEVQRFVLGGRDRERVLDDELHAHKTDASCAYHASTYGA